MDKLNVSSPNFKNNDFIPPKYTCNGEDINPQLNIKNIPKGTKSMALIVDDPDAPMGIFDHWLVWNIPPQETIEENSAPGIEGTNSMNKIGYGGPCPPSGVHRYFFKVYALDTLLNLSADTSKQELIDAMSRHVLGEGVLMGKYGQT